MPLKHSSFLSGCQNWSRMNPKIRFVIEILVLWVLFCLPINLLTIFLSSVAPSYDHELADQKSAQAANELTFSQFHNATILTSKDNLTDQDIILDQDVAQVSKSRGSRVLIQQGNATLSCYDVFNNHTSELMKSWDFWVSGVSLFVAGILGIIGNILTLITLICYENRNSFNKLLIYLAVVDLLLILTFILEFSILNEFLQGQPYWYRMMFPYFVHPLKHILLSLCIFLMVAVSSERCQAICHPLRERPSPRSYLLAVTILALSLNARKFAEFKYDADRMSYETTSVMEYPTYIIISNTWQELFVTGLLPFVALVYCNIRIYCKIRESSKHEKYRYVGGNHIQEISQQGASGPQFEDHELHSFNTGDFSGSAHGKKGSSPPSSAQCPNGTTKKSSPVNSTHLMESFRKSSQRRRRRFQWLSRCVSMRTSAFSSNGSDDSSLPRNSDDTPSQGKMAVMENTKRPRAFFLRRRSTLSSSIQSNVSNKMNRAQTSFPKKLKSSTSPTTQIQTRNGIRTSLSIKGEDRRPVPNSPLFQLTTASDEFSHFESGIDRNRQQCVSDIHLATNGGRSSPFLSRKSTISDKGGVPSSIQTSSHQSNSNGGVEVGAKRTSLSFYESSKPSSTRGQRVLRKRHEKSVLILVLIVFVFLVCHSFRLGVQTFQTLHSEQSTKDHYNFCMNRPIPRLNYPVEFVILSSFNNLFLVLNSSINFIVYCAVRKTFRKTIFRILRCQSRNVNSV